MQQYEVIRSRENKLYKRLLGLISSARDRKQSGESVLDGAHLVEAFLQSGRTVTDVVLAADALHSADWRRIAPLVGAARVSVLSEQLMRESSQLQSPASLMAIVPTPVGEVVPPNADAVLVLDNVQDPGNVGALIRCAAAFGVPHVLMGRGTAFAWSPKVLRAGQGGHFAVNIVEGLDLLEWIQAYHGVVLAFVAPSAGASPIEALDLTRPTALMIGNEGSGLSAELILASSAKAHIRMRGHMESLNAASSGAIAMYEMSRQRSSADALNSNFPGLPSH